jgi:hypothetical protein
MSRAKQFMKVLETGEPGQDYDTESYNAICNALKGYKCTHKEFDKYQGVYITATGKGGTAKIWTMDSFTTGKRKTSGAQWSSAILTDPDGEELSATRGDYFMKPPGYVFKDCTLTLVDMQGKETVIDNPEISDLPDTGEVEHTFSYEGEPTYVFVMWIEGTDEDDQFEVSVAPDGKADVSNLKDALDSYFMSKGKK